MSYSITDKCVGCAACASLCPVLAIDGVKGERYHINDTRCVECGVCGRICPVSAVSDRFGDIAEKVSKTEWPIPEIDKSLCTACGLCREICTRKCLEISDPEFRGDVDLFAMLADKKKCVGCGLCADICPMNAIRMNPETVKKRVDKKNKGIKLPVYAVVDLSGGKVETLEIPESIFRKYVGGKALAARILLDRMPVGIDALDADAVIVVNTGPLTGTGAPSTSRFNITFKHVISGGIASSNCGGFFGSMLKRAGYDGLIITGKTSSPVRIEITDGNISILPADDLWGMNVEEVQDCLPAHHSKLVIGPAGENLIAFSGVISGERIAGRCGGGAVFGSKMLKAVTCYGTAQPHIHNEAAFWEYVKKWTKFLQSHPMTGEALPRYGSAGLVNKANTNLALPVHNFKYGHDDNADAVSGETLAETLLVKNGACVSCPIRCERRVRVSGKEVKGPEYETLGLFGPNIGIHDLALIDELNYKCDILGMDTISCAGSIAFAMELKERGIADLGVSFGDGDSVMKAVEGIACGKGIYAEIGRGARWLAGKYGGKEFCIESKGLELAAYEPRRSVGMGLGYATSNRGACHLNGGYAALFESVGVLSISPQSPKGKAALTVFLQNSLEAVSTVGCCLFSAQTIVPAALYRLGPNHPVTRFIGKSAVNFGPVIEIIMKMNPVLKVNSMYLMPHAKAVALATGLPMSTGSFLALGNRCYNIERHFSAREGGLATEDTLPKRLTDELQDPADESTRVPFEKMLPAYYRIRGWTTSGTLKPSQLKKLGIANEPV